jgi:hypothetical protein
MAKELLNYRESRMTITNGYILGAAVVTVDEVRGRVVEPSKTVFDDEEAAAINADSQVKPLFKAKLIAWGETATSEEAPAPAPAEPKKK